MTVFTMASLCISCIIMFSILLQPTFCEDEDVNVTLVGYVGYYFPESPSPERDDWLRPCRVTPKLSWRKWENIEPSKCTTLYVSKNCVGYVLTKINPAVIDFKYAWRRQNPFPKCNFQHEGSMWKALRFNYLSVYNATQIITVIDRLCINLPMNMEYTSVEKSGVDECMELYEREDCVGNFYELPESTPNYISVPLNRIVNSYKPCNRKSVFTTETDKIANMGEKGLTINVSGPENSNLPVLFGLFSLILLLLVSAFIFGMFYLRRRIFPHLYEVPTVAEQQELANVRQSMCQRPTQNIYGPVMKPQINIDLLA